MATVKDFHLVMEEKIDTVSEKIADMMLSDDDTENMEPYTAVELLAQKEVFEGAVKLSNTLSTLSSATDEHVFFVLKSITHQALMMALEAMDKKDLTSDQKQTAVGAHAGYTVVIEEIEAIGF